MLSDKQIQAAVFAVLRKWGTDRAWDRYTREVGPYDVTELRPEVFEIIRAVLAVADGVQGCSHCYDGGCGDPLGCGETDRRNAAASLAKEQS